MEVDERPTEQYSDIGGLDKQIQELIEAVVLPMTHKERLVRLIENFLVSLSVKWRSVLEYQFCIREVVSSNPGDA